MPDPTTTAASLNRALIRPVDCPEPEWHETHRYCPACSWHKDVDVTQPGFAPRRVVLLLQRKVFEPTREFWLPEGMPLPRIGEAVVPPDDGEGGPPYVVEKVEHDPGKKRVLVVARPSDWSDDA